jgi:hypothetical protein
MGGQGERGRKTENRKRADKEDLSGEEDKEPMRTRSSCKMTVPSLV